MKINEILRMSSEILNLDLKDDDFTGAAPGNLVKILLNSCNFVYEELYRDYATAIRKTTIEVVGGFADTTPYRLCKVISLVDAEGNDVNFRYGDGGLYVETDGRYNLTYARLPEVLGWGDEVLLPSPRITERMLVYGTVREFYAITGDWANAQQWDTRFKDALQVAGVKTSSMRMPVGRWL